MQAKRLGGRAALVTGGARGIGAAICKRLAQEGARVCILDLLEDEGAKLAAEISGLFVHCDLSDDAALREGVRNAESELGSLDILVSNAGYDVMGPFVESRSEDWDRIIAINLRGPIALAHAVLPHMVERQGGRVIFISSDAARVGSSGEAVYAACKAGVIALAKTLAREHARHQITVNAICPGPTETTLLQDLMDADPRSKKILDAAIRAIPMRRAGQPEDVVGAVAFLASDDAAFITGQTLSVSGGLTMS